MNWRIVMTHRREIRRRAVVFWSTLTFLLGAALTLLLVPQLAHLYNSSAHPPAGGRDGFVRGAVGLGLVGSVAAMIVGSYGGSETITAGVMRELVAAGGSRVGLYASRLVATLAFFVPLLTAAYVLEAVLTVAFTSNWAQVGGGFGVGGLGLGGPGGSAVIGATGVTGLPGVSGQPVPGQPVTIVLHESIPSFGQFAGGYGWVLLFTCFALVLAYGLAATTTSRAATVGGLLAFELLVTPVLVAVPELGAYRNLLFLEALARLFPLSGEGVLNSAGLSESVVSAVLVLVGWAVVFAGAGGVRTVRRSL